MDQVNEKAIQEDDMSQLIEQNNNNIPTDDTNMELVEYLLPFKKGLTNVDTRILAIAAYKILKESLVFACLGIGQSVFIAINFSLLSKYKDEVMLTAFSLSISLHILFFMAMYWSSLDKIGIDLSLYTGGNNFHEVRRVFGKGLLTMLILFMSFTFPILFFSQTVLTLIGISKDVAGMCQFILRCRTPSMIVEVLGSVLRVFCMSQGQESVFGYTGLITAAFAMLVSYLTIEMSHLGVFGFILADFSCSAINLIICFSVYFQIPSYRRGLPSLSDACSGLCEFVGLTIKYAIGTYIEMIGQESITFFISLRHDNAQISAFSCIINVVSFGFRLGYAVASIIRTRVNILLGMKQAATAKSVFKFSFILSVFLGLVVSAILYFARNPIAQFYTSGLEDEKRNLVILLTIYSIMVPNELSIHASIGGMRTIKKANLLVLYSCMFALTLNLSVSTFIYNVYYEYANVGTLFTVLMIAVLFNNISCFITIIQFNWETLVHNNDEGDKIENGKGVKAVVYNQGAVGGQGEFEI